jgi:hypothetical protein
VHACDAVTAVEYVPSLHKNLAPEGMACDASHDGDTTSIANAAIVGR